MSSHPTSGKLLAVDQLSAGRGRPSARRPPPPGALLDGHRRSVRYLRLSVTDRCNLRCRYCMPAEGMAFSPRERVLRFDELERVVRAFVALGIRRLRLTGGEPLLRKGFVSLVEALGRVEGVEDMALSTNGLLLPPVAARLRAAGVTRVNISVDTLRADRFRDLTRTGRLERVLAAVDAALAHGYAPVKLNAVVIRGFNDDELSALVRFAAAKGALLRFVEYMPIGLDGFWSDRTFLATEEMLARLEDDWIIHPWEGFAAEAGVIGGGPARYGLLEPRRGGGAPVRVGFISALSHNFCDTCNRVRVTAAGALQQCLAYPGELSLRDAMRGGASDLELVALIERGLFGKAPGHSFDGGQRTAQAMSVTGG